MVKGIYLISKEFSHWIKYQNTWYHQQTLLSTLILTIYLVPTGLPSAITDAESYMHFIRWDCIILTYLLILSRNMVVLGSTPPCIKIHERVHVVNIVLNGYLNKYKQGSILHSIHHGTILHRLWGVSTWCWWKVQAQLIVHIGRRATAPTSLLHICLTQILGSFNKWPTAYLWVSNKRVASFGMEWRTCTLLQRMYHASHQEGVSKLGKCYLLRHGSSRWSKDQLLERRISWA